MFKLLLVLALSGALANGLASANSQPPLLIDNSPSAVHLDAVD